MADKLNFVMISPHFPANFETFAHRLYESGINTLGIADVPYEQLSEGLRQHLTEYYRVDDMQDYDQVYRAVGYFAHKYGRIDRVESHNEFWLELDARLRTDFNVFGFKNEDMLAIKTKRQMKEVFRRQGLKVAAGDTFKTDQEAKELAQKLGFPIIVKPNSGVGASDTYKLTRAEELAHFLAQRSLDVDYIMEEFIAGDIITFDGLADHDGRIVFYSSLEHSEAVLDTVVNGTDMYYFLPRDIDPELVALGKKCVSAFNIKERFFHFEFFRIKETEEIIPLEVNCRPPGGLTIDMWNYANDFDIFKEYVNVVKENRFKADSHRPYNVFYISRRDDMTYKHSLDEIRHYFGQHLVTIASVPGVFSAIMGKDGIIGRCPDRKTMRDLIRYAQEKV
ncbi:ATP-grasp domain-containing protein [Streptococcus halotolerans]|uniref:ATP-grasp domain-containing protein n=1 Tax=Streptococcus halotolerans TaxID=1814128 RepID=UPI000786CF39|nr:ATP-grasp domain-containing protein [Streptococcus halotolerans]